MFAHITEVKSHKFRVKSGRSMGGSRGYKNIPGARDTIFERPRNSLQDPTFIDGDFGHMGLNPRAPDP